MIYPLRKLGGCAIDIEAGTYQQFRVSIRPATTDEEQRLDFLLSMVFQSLHFEGASRYLDILQTDDARLPDNFPNETS